MKFRFFFFIISEHKKKIGGYIHCHTIVQVKLTTLVMITADLSKC
jgi:hypothetical protein